jgi:hypothetical protein
MTVLSGPAPTAAAKPSSTPWNSGTLTLLAQPPLDRAGRRPHETIEIKPFVLVRADRHRALTAPGPNPPDERLQAEAMLVEGPQLDRTAGRLGLGRVHRGGEVFLKASCASGPAALACRGRGHCRLNPRRCR